MMALTAFDDGMRLILGGSLKGGSFAELAEAVADGPVAGVYLIGQAADAIAAELDRARRRPYRRRRPGHGRRPGRRRRASPATRCCCRPPAPSFDQFRDYEHRGDEFRRLAREVPVGV